MLPWLLALVGLGSLPLALLWRRAGERRDALESRLGALEDRLEAIQEDARRGAETAALLQRLLVEKGLADVEDFDGPPDAAAELPRGKGLH